MEGYKKEELHSHESRGARIRERESSQTSLPFIHQPWKPWDSMQLRPTKHNQKINILKNQIDTKNNFKETQIRVLKVGWDGLAINLLESSFNVGWTRDMLALSLLKATRELD